MQFYQFLYGSHKINVASATVEDAWHVAFQMCVNDGGHLTLLPFIDLDDFDLDLTEGETVH